MIGFDHEMLKFNYNNLFMIIFSFIWIFVF